MAQLELWGRPGLFQAVADTTQAEAFVAITRLLNGVVTLPSDWRWQLREAGSEIFLDVISPRYPGSLTITNVSVRAFDYPSVFGDQTSPIRRDDPYGTAVRLLHFIVIENRALPQMILNQIAITEGQLSRDEARRLEAIAAEERRKAEAAAAEAAAKEAAEKAKKKAPKPGGAPPDGTESDDTGRDNLVGPDEPGTLPTPKPTEEEEATATQNLSVQQAGLAGGVSTSEALKLIGAFLVLGVLGYFISKS